MSDDPAHGPEDRSARSPHRSKGLARARQRLSACGPLCAGARDAHRAADALLTRQCRAVVAVIPPAAHRRGGARRRAERRRRGRVTPTPPQIDPDLSRDAAAQWFSGISIPHRSANRINSPTGDTRRGDWMARWVMAEKRERPPDRRPLRRWWQTPTYGAIGVARSFQYVGSDAAHFAETTLCAGRNEYRSV